MWAISGWLVHTALRVPRELQAETLTVFELLAASIPVVTVTSGLRGILEALGLAVEVCAAASDVSGKLAHTRYDAVVVDCENEPEALDALRQVRSSSRCSRLCSFCFASSPNVTTSASVAPYLRLSE